ncbi:hypothetical protein E8E11_000888 [Didymella keratinophila]|nr:hypothetical protein E8E11_000888 [Didymella keratinophila]
MAGRRDSFDLPVGGPTRNRSDSVHTISSNASNASNVSNGSSCSSGSSGSSGRNSASSLDSLNFDRLSLENNYIRFEHNFRRLIKLAQEILSRDHTFDSLSARTLNTQQYYSLRDHAANWVSKPENAALFTDRKSYFCLAQMAATMQTLEIALAIPHQPIKWPGAAPGPSPVWPGVSKHEVFCQFDQLVKGDREVYTKAMPWNRRDDVAVSD